MTPDSNSFASEKYLRMRNQWTGKVKELMVLVLLIHELVTLALDQLSGGI